MSEFLTKEQIVSRKQFPFQLVELPTGGKVQFRVPKSRDWRLHQRSLRDDEGNYLDDRMDRGDELLVATLLIDASGKRMFSLDEIMAGALDDVDAADLNVMTQRAYELYGRGGKVPKLEAIEKKSEGTPSNE